MIGLDLASVCGRFPSGRLLHRLSVSRWGLDGERVISINTVNNDYISEGFCEKKHSDLQAPANNGNHHTGKMG